MHSLVSGFKVLVWTTALGVARARRRGKAGLDRRHAAARLGGGLCSGVARACRGRGMPTASCGGAGERG